MTEGAARNRNVPLVNEQITGSGHNEKRPDPFCLPFLSSNSRRQRVKSISSIRSRKRPSFFLAVSNADNAEYACPECSNPVGLGGEASDDGGRHEGSTTEVCAKWRPDIVFAQQACVNRWAHWCSVREGHKRCQCHSLLTPFPSPNPQFMVDRALEIAVAEDSLGNHATGVQATSCRSDDAFVDQQIDVLAYKLC